MRNFATRRGGRNLCDLAAKRPAPPSNVNFCEIKEGGYLPGRRKYEKFLAGGEKRFGFPASELPDKQNIICQKVKF